jgi:hypothetical protein
MWDMRTKAVEYHVLQHANATVYGMGEPVPRTVTTLLKP